MPGRYAIADVYHSVATGMAWFVDPATWALALAVLAVAASRLRAWVGAGMALAAAGIAVAGMAPYVADALQIRLERDAVDTYRLDREYDAVVVLAAGDARVDGGVQLMTAGRAQHLVYVGALSNAEVEQVTRRVGAADIPPERVVIEAESRNTHENVRAASQILAAHGWRSVVVVTSATHVSRTLGCFAKVGVVPDAMVVDRLAPAVPRLSWLPDRRASNQVRHAAHELIARGVYRVMGYLGEYSPT